jgi:hypothetical protein
MSQKLHFEYFCACGLPVYKEKGCPKHKYSLPYETVVKKQRIGRYSGKSKSEHAFNDYQ